MENHVIAKWVWVLYLFFVCLLLAIPLSFWERGENLWGKLRAKFRYRGSQARGHQLVEALGLFDAQRAIGKKDHPPLPQYKFYTKLVEAVLEYGRNFGAPIAPLLLDLRRGVIKDRQFEGRLAGELRGTLAQFVLVTAITWMFIILCQHMAQVHASVSAKGGVAALQLSGGIVYGLSYYSLRKKLFLHYPRYLSTLMTLQALSQVGVPLGMVLKRARPGELSSAPPLTILHGRLEALIVDWQNLGIPVKERLNELLDEVWFSLEQRFETFLKAAALLKFACLALFFLSSYLLYLYFLFSFFLQ